MCSTRAHSSSEGGTVGDGLAAMSVGEPVGADAGWFDALDNVDLTSVGIDVGSTTTHLVFSWVHLKRESDKLSSRFVVTDRKVLWRSDIRLTPYVAGNRIDADEVATFVHAGYKEAGFSAGDMDTGAIILTGEALKQGNAKALAVALAADAGQFVCVSAGHHLEATLAAHGSGTVDVATHTGRRVLCIDIGGGTTKFAVACDGTVAVTAAIEVGGGTLSWDEEGVVQRAASALGHLGAEVRIPRVGERVGPALRRAIAGAATELILSPARRDRAAVPEALVLTGPLPPSVEHFDAVTFSGGVAEYIYGRESAYHHDLGRDIGEAVRAVIDSGGIDAPVLDPGNGIRSTVIGASQASVQVSGSTVSVLDERLLPLLNVPVLHPLVDLDGPVDPAIVAAAIRDSVALAPDVGSTIALSFRFRGAPSYERILGLAEGIGRAVGGTGSQLDAAVVIIDRDIAATLGSLLEQEVDVQTPVLCLDTLELRPLDYVDVGRRILPAGVFPVMIKSLLFGS